MTKLLTVNNLTVAIAGRKICSDLNFELFDNMCLGILGVNGAGKTTLLRTLLGILPPQNGEIKLSGKNISYIKAKTKAKLIGVLLQQHNFNFPATVFEVALHSRFTYADTWGNYSCTNKNIVSQYLKEFSLDGEQMVDTLSGGELQRLAISMLLAQQPSVYLLDEPLNNLDLRYHLLIERNFGKQSGKSSVVILHDLLMVGKMCSHLLMLKNGEYLFGRLADTYTKENLQWLFEIEMQAVDIGYPSFSPK